MRYATRTPGYISTEFLPRGVKWLLIVNVALFVVYFLAESFGLGGLFAPFGLVPDEVTGRFAIWQLFTYMFIHDPHGFMHILMNMLMLYMFGADLERVWGRREFLKYYVICGAGAGVCVVLAAFITHTGRSWTIGASGAIFGLLLAFGVLFPDRVVLFSFLFPMKAKYMVMIFGAIEFLTAVYTRGGGPVSNLAHLGGMLFGYLYLRGWLNFTKVDIGKGGRQLYQQWKLNRAKRKFQVYLRKQDRDRTIH